MKIFSQPLPDLPNPFDMLPVEGGTFHMGDEHGDLWEACRPVHPVTVSDFYIAKFPVTQALWRAVVTAPIDGVAQSHPVNQLKPNPSKFQGDERPVEQVLWDDAQLFIQKINKITKNSRLAGHHYYLPTEAEWEYAARGGKFHTEGYKYSGSDRLKDVGWFYENSGSETKPIGLKYPNQLGIHDMSGNVWEWSEDLFGDSAYYEACKQKGNVVNPYGPESGSLRVIRGGSWNFNARNCRAAGRNLGTPGTRGDGLGFRLVLAPQSVGRPSPAFL